MTDELLALAAAERAEGRLPALTWIHPATGAPLCRSAQPRAGVGVDGAALRHDVALLCAVRDAALAGAGAALATGGDRGARAGERARDRARARGAALDDGGALSPRRRGRARRVRG